MYANNFLGNEILIPNHVSNLREGWEKEAGRIHCKRLRLRDFSNHGLQTKGEGRTTGKGLYFFLIFNKGTDASPTPPKKKKQDCFHSKASTLRKEKRGNKKRAAGGKVGNCGAVNGPGTAL